MRNLGQELSAVIEKGFQKSAVATLDKKKMPADVLQRMIDVIRNEGLDLHWIDNIGYVFRKDNDRKNDV